jgi:hypothetical protein
MKSDRVKIVWQSRLGKLFAGGLVAISVSMAGTPAARAGLLDNLKQLSSNIQNAVNQFNAFSESVATNITNYAIVAANDVYGLLGKFGQFDPEKLEQKLKENVNSENQHVKILEGARATTEALSNRILSQTGQEQAAETQKQLDNLGQTSYQISDQVYSAAQRNQSEGSSQNILKGISQQLSGLADINAAALQVAISNSKDNQESKMQDAATNLALSKIMEETISSNQQKFIREASNAKYFADSTYDHLTGK